MTETFCSSVKTVNPIGARDETYTLTLSCRLGLSFLWRAFFLFSTLKHPCGILFDKPDLLQRREGIFKRRKDVFCAFGNK